MQLTSQTGDTTQRPVPTSKERRVRRVSSKTPPPLLTTARSLQGMPPPVVSSITSDTVLRNASGEHWRGMKAAAWMWQGPAMSSPSNQVSGAAASYASHWSEAPAEAESLYRRSEVQELVEFFKKNEAKARENALDDVVHMLCRRFDLRLDADLGPKLIGAVNQLRTPAA